MDFYGNRWRHFHGIPWKSQKTFPWNSIEVHGEISVEFHGMFLWKLCPNPSWNSMEFFSMEMHGQISLEFHGNQCLNPPWNSMEVFHTGTLTCYFSCFVYDYFYVITAFRIVWIWVIFYFYRACRACTNKHEVRTLFSQWSREALI